MPPRHLADERAQGLELLVLAQEVPRRHGAVAGGSRPRRQRAQAGVHFQEALEDGAGGSRSGKGGSKNGGSSNGGSSKREGRSMGGRETAAGSKHRLGWRYAHSKRPPQTAHEAKAPLQG